MSLQYIQWIITYRFGEERGPINLTQLIDYLGPPVEAIESVTEDGTRRQTNWSPKFANGIMADWLGVVLEQNPTSPGARSLVENFIGDLQRCPANLVGDTGHNHWWLGHLLSINRDLWGMMVEDKEPIEFTNAYWLTALCLTALQGNMSELGNVISWNHQCPERALSDLTEGVAQKLFIPPLSF